MEISAARNTLNKQEQQRVRTFMTKVAVLNAYEFLCSVTKKRSL